MIVRALDDVAVDPSHSASNVHGANVRSFGACSKTSARARASLRPMVSRMERNEKTEGPRHWVTAVQAGLASGFIAEVMNLILRADKMSPNGLLLHGAFLGVVLLAAILLQKVFVQKRDAAPPSKDVRSEPDQGRQLVGEACDACGDRIVMQSSGSFCDDCGVALHTRACATRHAKNAHPAVALSRGASTG